MENKIVWKATLWLSSIRPVRIIAKDEDTVTLADWPQEVVKKVGAGPHPSIYPTWEDAHAALVEYQQGKIDTLQAQLEQQLVKLDSINHLKKPNV
jgi:hypothetical protein